MPFNQWSRSRREEVGRSRCFTTRQRPSTSGRISRSSSLRSCAPNCERRRCVNELQLKTTGRGLWARRLGAAGFGDREFFLREALPQVSLDASATRKAFFVLLWSGLPRKRNRFPE